MCAIDDALCDRTLSLLVERDEVPVVRVGDKNRQQLRGFDLARIVAHRLVRAGFPGPAFVRVTDTLLALIHLTMPAWLKDHMATLNDSFYIISGNHFRAPYG